MKILSVLLAVNLLLVPATSFAVENTSATMLSSPGISASSVLVTLGGLLLVLVCIAFLAWLLRSSGRFNSAANGELQIIAGLSLGTREKAVLLQVGTQQILVGITPQQIQTLLVLEHNINQATEQTSGQTTGHFANKLKQYLQQQHTS